MSPPKEEQQRVTPPGDPWLWPIWALYGIVWQIGGSAFFHPEFLWLGTIAAGLYVAGHMIESELRGNSFTRADPTALSLTLTALGVGIMTLDWSRLGEDRGALFSQLIGGVAFALLVGHGLALLYVRFGHWLVLRTPNTPYRPGKGFSRGSSFFLLLAAGAAAVQGHVAGVIVGDVSSPLAFKAGVGLFAALLAPYAFFLVPRTLAGLSSASPPPPPRPGAAASAHLGVSLGLPFTLSSLRLLLREGLSSPASLPHDRIAAWAGAFYSRYVLEPEGRGCFAPLPPHLAAAAAIAEEVETQWARLKSTPPDGAAENMPATWFQWWLARLDKAAGDADVPSGFQPDRLTPEVVGAILDLLGEGRLDAATAAAWAGDLLEESLLSFHPGERRPAMREALRRLREMGRLPREERTAEEMARRALALRADLGF